jgi:hypothetical protein
MVDHTDRSGPLHYIEPAPEEELRAKAHGANQRAILLLAVNVALILGICAYVAYRRLRRR